MSDHDLKILITQGGYRAALQNAQNHNGFRIELTHADIYSNGVKKTRIAIKGTQIGDKSIKVRGVISSESEEYHYNEIQLIDGISNTVFCSIKRADNGTLDYVSQYKRSTISYTLTFSTLQEHTITIAGAQGSDTRSEEESVTDTIQDIIDTHIHDNNAHQDLFNKKLDKSSVSSAVDSNSESTVASSKAVKLAYDKANEVFNKVQDGTLSNRGLIQLSSTLSDDETQAATPKLVKQAYDKAQESDKKGLPVGAILAFPKGTTPAGFLKCDGSSFSQSVYPDLWQFLQSEKLPDLSNIDIGQLAYFPFSQVPTGWVAFDEIDTTVTNENYPKLYKLLIKQFGTIENVPKSEDRFIRGLGSSLTIGQQQSDEIKKHGHKIFSHYPTHPDIGLTGYQNTNDLTASNWSHTWSDSERHDNGWCEPLADSKAMTGGEETRPKAIAFKLCIKAIAGGTDVDYYIKAFGTVASTQDLQVTELATSIQESKRLIEELKSDIDDVQQLQLKLNNTSFEELENAVFALANAKPLTLEKVLDGNISNRQTFNTSKPLEGHWVTVLCVTDYRDNIYFGVNTVKSLTFYVPAGRMNGRAAWLDSLCSGVELKKLSNSEYQFGNLEAEWRAKVIYRHNYQLTFSNELEQKLTEFMNLYRAKHAI